MHANLTHIGYMPKLRASGQHQKLRKLLLIAELLINAQEKHSIKAEYVQAKINDPTHFMPCYSIADLKRDLNDAAYVCKRLERYYDNKLMALAIMTHAALFTSSEDYGLDYLPDEFKTQEELDKADDIPEWMPKERFSPSSQPERYNNAL